MARRFQKKLENFKCDNCGYEVVGFGYTNHCTQCLWSKHVDIFPGDRKEDCKGLMRPIRIEKKKDGYVIVHKCERCGEERKNKASPQDNFEQIIKIS
ncbi:MAG: RNHCP domain-containing protein [Patescibacteria group bacterium]|nr:RNHCP domain-containing protein [Patescibacteria group bacterium]MBU1952774.1 RNHCP domain-containing protein [Patescibacteria group bacterium]